MKRLTPLGDDPAYIDRYVAIRNQKRLAVRNQLVAAHPFVEERYDKLDEAIAADTLRLMEVDGRAAPIGDALRACYGGSTQPLKDLKKAITAAQPKRLLKYCPMCGTTIHSTFDHYLPAVRFPEFSVHPLNLIPCCSKCNSTKNDDWLTPAGRRQYLHAFSDEIPDATFVTVTLHEGDVMTGVGASFSLVRPNEIEASTWVLIKSHFDRLHLLERYAELSNDEIAEMLSDCRIFLDSGGPDVRQFLGHCAQERFGIHGRNHWRAVLMQALAEHENLDSWLEVA
ncbi:HNH endonuclease [Polaromonas sp. P2-4]|nr:HNH endonuclease [Polaromonas sp. P2-4]